MDLVTTLEAMRPDKEDYYCGIAEAVAQRGTCTRRKVGAIVVVNDAVVSTGYNGAPRGTRHCDHYDDRDMEVGHCSRAVHAESNAVLNAARNGVGLAGGTMYATATVCYRCAPLLVQAGIVAVVMTEKYREDERALNLLREAKVRVYYNSKEYGFQQIP